MGWFLGNIGKEIAHTRLNSELTLGLSGTSSLLNQTFSKPLILARLITKNERVKEIIRSPKNPEGIEKVIQLLDRYKEESGAHRMAVFSEEGILIASDKEIVRHLGKDLSFRPYVRKSLKGKESHYFAYGAVDKIRGYYASVPVFDNLDNVIGVAMAKYKLDELALNIDKYEHMYLVSPEGIILLSSNSGWLSKSLYPIDQKRRNQLKQSRQFGDNPIEQLNLNWDTKRQEVSFNDSTFLFKEFPVTDDGWKLVMFVQDTLTAEYQWVLAALSFCLFVITVGCMLFIFKKKQTEIVLEQYNLNLERMVLERTKDLEKAHKQLQQAQKMEAMGTLAGGIAHDFNNLLMTIQGRTSIMLMKKDSSHPDIAHLKGIEDNVDSAADLTKQLLGFARGGKYEVKPTDINELIKKQNRMFGRTKKEITIRGKHEKDLWVVETDKGQIGQVLMNLYVNAWQAMPSGGELDVQTENVLIDEDHNKTYQMEPGRYVKISVTDTGVGMDKATQERIFDPFFTTKEMGRGTGLGLASVYGIIKNHGGLIDVYSEKGHGTTFNIYLPASEKEVIEEKKSAGDILKGSETVLFVDDENMIIEVAKEVLEHLGYKVLISKTGKEAIETYHKNKEKIDIVLLDMIMPDMSGGDTYDNLKEIDPDIKVLLSSGYSINGQATEIMDRGCNGFIQKPFKMKELSQKLREILDGK